MTAVHEEQVTKGKNPKLFLQLFPKELINLLSIQPSVPLYLLDAWACFEASIVAKDRLHDNSRSMSKLDEIKQTKKILIS